MSLISAQLKVQLVDFVSQIHLLLQPIPLGVTFSNAVSKLKAQSSKLKRLFCHVSLKRHVRALGFEL